MLAARLHPSGARQWAVIAAGGAAAAVLFAPVAALVDVAVGAPGEAVTVRTLGAEARALIVPATLVWTAINGSRFLKLGAGPAPARSAGSSSYLTRPRAVLRAGLSVPVARSRMAAVRAAL